MIKKIAKQVKRDVKNVGKVTKSAVSLVGKAAKSAASFGIINKAGSKKPKSQRPNRGSLAGMRSIPRGGRGKTDRK